MKTGNERKNGKNENTECGLVRQTHKELRNEEGHWMSERTKHKVKIDNWCLHTKGLHMLINW